MSQRNRQQRRPRGGCPSWTPPSESVRRDAVGEIQKPAALVAATKSCSGGVCCQHSGCFVPKIPAKTMDWLADGQPGELERSGQSFEQFSKLKRRLPKEQQREILLCNLDCDSDNSDEACQKIMEIFRQFVEIYFGMPCYVTRPLSSKERGQLKGRIDVLPQLQTGPIHKILGRRLRSTKTAFCIMGVTLVDLYPSKDWNFAFGEAAPMKGTGVFSVARITGAWQEAWNAQLLEENSTTKEESWSLSWKEFLQDPLAVRRALQTLVHESCHLFHLEHCVYYQCVMNGAKHLAEGDASPMHLCPVCLHKLYSAVAKTRTPLDVMRRYQGLAEILRRTTHDAAQLEEDGVWYCQAVDRCNNYLNGSTTDPMDASS